MSAELAALDDSIFGAQGARRQDKGDASLLVRFYKGSRKDEQASKQEGRPIFRDVDYIQIMVPGDRTNSIDRPVREKDKERFAVQYADYSRRGQNEESVGTPLEQWPLLSKAQVEELRHFHVRTVEQLAAMPDNRVQQFAGMQQLKTRAKLFLEAAAGNAPMLRLQEEVEKKDAEIASLQDAISKLTARIEAQEKRK
jgi:hypothetical protein